MAGVSGIHHVTCVVGDMVRAQKFYVDFLGLVPLRRTVNFDETSVLQLYCGDVAGSPGTIVSLLNHKGDRPAFRGTGQVSNIVFSIERGSEPLWEAKLAENETVLDGYGWSFGQRVLCISDPDGTALSLSPAKEGAATPTHVGRKPRVVVGRIQSVELQTRYFDHTARVLSSLLGFHHVDREGPVTRFQNSKASDQFEIDLLSTPMHRPGTDGVGTVHHLAWLVTDVQALEEMRAKVVTLGFDASPILDRYYFKAVYFSGPENIMFGFATQGPGLLTPAEEPPDVRVLSLPPWLESRRARIEGAIN